MFGPICVCQFDLALHKMLYAMRVNQPGLGKWAGKHCVLSFSLLWGLVRWHSRGQHLISSDSTMYDVDEQ